MSDFNRKYYLNNKQVDRRTFYKSLKNQHYRSRRVSRCGNFGVDIENFDNKGYRQSCKKLNGYNGYAPVVLGFDRGEGLNIYKIQKQRKTKK